MSQLVKIETTEEDEQESEKVTLTLTIEDAVEEDEASKILDQQDTVKKM